MSNNSSPGAPVSRSSARAWLAARRRIFCARCSAPSRQSSCSSRRHRSAGATQRSAFAGTSVETGRDADSLPRTPTWQGSSRPSVYSAPVRTIAKITSRRRSAFGMAAAFAFKACPPAGRPTARMLARYRLAPLRTQALVRSMLDRWTLHLRASAATGEPCDAQGPV